MTAVLLVCLAALTQPAPDFSGRWTIPAPPAQAPNVSGDMGSGWGSTITVAQTASALTVEYAFFTRGDMQPPMTFTFALDGSESKNTVMMGNGYQLERSKAVWEGQTLVITTLHAFTDPSTRKPATFEVTRKLSLESPNALIVETTRGSALGGPPSATRVVYRRAPPALFP